MRVWVVLGVVVLFSSQLCAENGQAEVLRGHTPTVPEGRALTTSASMRSIDQKSFDNFVTLQQRRSDAFGQELSRDAVLRTETVDSMHDWLLHNKGESSFSVTCVIAEREMNNGQPVGPEIYFRAKGAFLLPVHEATPGVLGENRQIKLGITKPQESDSMAWDEWRQEITMPENLPPLVTTMEKLSNGGTAIRSTAKLGKTHSVLVRAIGDSGKLLFHLRSEDEVESALLESPLGQANMVLKKVTVRREAFCVN
jgi:hypothetical protein